MCPYAVKSQNNGDVFKNNGVVSENIDAVSENIAVVLSLEPCFPHFSSKFFKNYKETSRFFQWTPEDFKD